MSTTVVLPSIDPAYTAECIATMRFVNPNSVPIIDRNRQTDIIGTHGPDWTHGKPDTTLVVVWNTPEHNLGVAGSWNVGVEKMYEHGHDWLVILSAGVRFGEAGGRDFLDELRNGTQFLATGMHSAGRWPSQLAVKAIEAGGGLGWHLIAFHRSVFLKVGYFDTNFHPAYHEDNDMSYRIQLAYGIDSRSPEFVGPLWPKVSVDAELASVAHGIIRGGVTVDFVALEDYYVRKWGGKSGEERFTTPFDSGNPVSWYPAPREVPA